MLGKAACLSLVLLACSLQGLLGEPNNRQPPKNGKTDRSGLVQEWSRLSSTQNSQAIARVKAEEPSHRLLPPPFLPTRGIQQSGLTSHKTPLSDSQRWAVATVRAPRKPAANETVAPQERIRVNVLNLPGFDSRAKTFGHTLKAQFSQDRFRESDLRLWEVQLRRKSGLKTERGPVTEKYGLKKTAPL